MNLRRMNANERFNGLLKLLFFISLLILSILPYNESGKGIISLSPHEDIKEKNYTKLYLSNYSCSYIYNETMDNKLIYSEYYNRSYFTDRQITVYYMANCLKLNDIPR